MDREDVSAILRLGRFQYLLGGFFLFSVGYLLAVWAGADIDLGRFAFGYTVLACAHLSVSYTNDLFDAEADQYTTTTPFSGGSKVLVERPELRPVARVIGTGLILASLILGALFFWYYGIPPPYYGLVVLGNLLGYFYTAPPARLAYRGLGELATMVTIGLLVPAMGYLVASGGLDLAFLVFVPPLLLYGLLFIVTVQQPDMEGDLRGGKTTVIVRRGRLFGYLVAAVSASLASLYFLVVRVATPGASPVDLDGVFLLSLLPTTITIGVAIRGDVRFEGASRATTSSIGSLFTFVILLAVYLAAGI
jgi:1,4-dihydroxy-2-naphthoate octaprenyltransferase